MRIGIYLVPLLDYVTGRERGVQGLLDGLARLDGANEYYLFVRPGNRRLFQRPEANFRTVVVRLPSLLSRRLWQLGHLYLICWAQRLDAIDLPESPMPGFCSERAVAMVHDVAPVLFPSFFPPKGRLFYQKALNFGVRHLRRITVPSQCTKNDLVTHLSADPDKVAVVSRGVDPQFQPSRSLESIEAVRQKYHLPDRFILYVGTLEPRKNVARLIRSYRLLRQEGIRHGLVIAGGRGWLCDDVFEAANRDGLGGDVVFTGHVPEEDLPTLYQAADVFAYPSLYEGFGLPVLEAMACGVPVVCSDQASLPEVAGEAALLVDPTEVREIAAALARVLHDGDLRQRMVDQGLERARQFTWERAARNVLSVYREVAGRGRCSRYC
jgi:glycosyltransferase involved in cell wall biosynthesis